MNKNISELKICDDRMFCYIMAKHPDITRRVLETILGIQIRSMKVVNAQKVLNYEPDVKAVRLDINGESSDERSFNMEMEGKSKKSMRETLPIRSRYYSSSLLTSKFPEGTKYEEMMEYQDYVIFICLFDPFRKNKPKYIVKSQLIEDSKWEFNDRLLYCFVNCTAADQEEDPELAALLRYFAGDNPKTQLSRDIQKLVEKYRKDKSFRRYAMTIGEEIELQKEEWFRTGKKEGINIGKKEGIRTGEKTGKKKGRQESQREFLEKMLRDPQMSAEMIQKYFPEYSVEEIAGMRQKQVSKTMN